jgi:hypothetical protein
MKKLEKLTKLFFNRKALSLLLCVTGVYQAMIVLSSINGLVAFSSFAGWNHTLNDIIFPWLWSNIVFATNSVAAIWLSYNLWHKQTQQ